MPAQRTLRSWSFLVDFQRTDKFRSSVTPLASCRLWPCPPVQSIRIKFLWRKPCTAAFVCSWRCRRRASLRSSSSSHGPLPWMCSTRRRPIHEASSRISSVWCWCHQFWQGFIDSEPQVTLIFRLYSGPSSVGEVTWHSISWAEMLAVTSFAAVLFSLEGQVVRVHYAVRGPHLKKVKIGLWQWNK